jgi:hypothetical protein
MAARIVTIVSSHGSVLAACGNISEALTVCQLAGTLAKGLRERMFLDMAASAIGASPPHRPAATTATSSRADQNPNVSPSLLALWSDRSAALLSCLCMYNVACVLRTMRGGDSAQQRNGVSTKTMPLFSGGSRRKLAQCEHDALAACVAYGAVDLSPRDPFLALLQSRLFEARQAVAADDDSGQHRRGHVADQLWQLHRHEYANNNEASLTATPSQQARVVSGHRPADNSLRYLRGAVGLLHQQRAMRRQSAGGGRGPRSSVQHLPLSRFSSWLEEG